MERIRNAWKMKILLHAIKRANGTKSFGFRGSRAEGEGIEVDNGVGIETINLDVIVTATTECDIKAKTSVVSARQTDTKGA